MSLRVGLTVAAVVLAACGGAVAPDTGPASSSGSSSSSSGSSSGGSSGGVCKDGEIGGYCPSGCRQACINGAWVCEGDCMPHPPPPPCDGKLPTCHCPTNCSCAATCDGQEWVCTSTCTADAGAPFACGDKDCNPGEVCTDTQPGVRYADGGTPPDYFQCVPTPDACVNNYTCPCVVQAFEKGGTSCSPSACSAPYGNIVVSCFGE